MAKRIESKCNGCPDCIGCGRKWENYTIWICDNCGFESYRELNSDIYGLDLCDKCYESEG